MDNNQNQNNVPTTNSNPTSETTGPYVPPVGEGNPEAFGKENLPSQEVKQELGDTAVTHSEGPAEDLGIKPASEGDSATELNPTDPATEAEPKEEV